MSTTAISRHIIHRDEQLLDALSKLNSLPGNEMTLFIEDDEHKIVGTLTDGDIRRALLSGAELKSAVKDIMYRSFKSIIKGKADIELLKECRERGITILPEIDEDGKICGIVNLNVKHTILPVSAILMAGGKGERLRPLTLDTPKPLLEIDGKAIIDYNIEALAACGITDITVCTRYLSEKIYDHFSKPVAGINVKCIREEIPLGTLGAASLINHGEEGTSLIMNSDLLTSISFEDFYMKHIAEQAAISIAVIPYQVSVPYAVLTTDSSQVTGIEEKPSFSYYANAGIYLISNKLLNTLEADKRIDATDFIQNAIADGHKVTYFPINGTWIDIGSPVDFRQAAEIMRHHRNMSDK
ncbi:MAG: NTP transferase domain-containing protein [Muribaculaceae bacterium]|nr:NTP transferase domain-containing protein [Muribaculaceae bacterium]